MGYFCLFQSFEGKIIFTYRGIGGRIRREYFPIIIGGLASLVTNIPGGPVSPGIFATVVLVGSQQCLLRVSFYSNTCDATPTHDDTLRRYQLIFAFQNLLHIMLNNLYATGANYITIINGRFGMEYVLDEATQQDSHQSSMLYDLGSCFPYVNMIQSGPKSRVYSRVNAGSKLESQNGWYSMEVRYGCDMVVKKASGVLWKTDVRESSQTGCYFALQMDGNGVLENESVCVWATNTMEGGLISSILVMQNDGNLVLYKTDTQKVVWASNTNNNK
ncbi:hypothetical protein SELMODRAFT_417092 [Selaginella moellendorffii]|uniref:Bulb-type lectin domain-containing protein n=1 Tax=Selaginella moellendorffii TaxID=88036 RepID=D8S1C0_SELML|nr:hypothetical protein SELMODRAFT_417092 [Selaginella moellendorffii]